MTLSKFLTLMALLVGFVATCYWIKSTMQISPKIIAELSATKFDSNPDIAKSLSAQKADAVIAFCLLLIAFVLQLTAQFVPESLVIVRTTLRGILLGVSIMIVVVVIAQICNQHIFKATEQAADKFQNEVT